MPTRDVPNFSDYAELLFGVLSQIRIDGLSGFQKEKDKKKKNCKKHVKREKSLNIIETRAKAQCWLT